MAKPRTGRGEDGYPEGIEVKDGKLLLEFKGTNLGAGDQNPVVSGMEIIRVG
jgi:hypothetical protein